MYIKENDTEETPSVTKIFNLDLQIDKNLISNVTFRDEKLEKIYQENKINEIFVDKDVIIILGWFCTLIYVIFYYYHPLTLTLCLIFTSLSFILVLKQKNYKSRSNKINFFQIFLFSFFQNLKCLLVNVYFIQEEQHKKEEIVRILIYDFVTFNLFDFLLLEESIIPRLLFLSTNILSATFSHFYRSDNIFHIDAITSTIYSLIFYLIKKSWECHLRNLFSKSYVLNKSLLYSNEFICETNGIHITKNKDTISISGNKEFQETFYKYFNINDQNYDTNFLEKNKFLRFSDQSEGLKTFLNSMIKYTTETYNNKDPQILILPDSVKVDYINKKKFMNLGVFYNPMLKDKFYEVFYRNFYIDEMLNVEDILFYDISTHVLSERKIIEDNIIKQRLYSKISHEFKTPLISIIGLIDNIKDSIHREDSETTNKNLDVISNLSKFIIFLTKDIIQIQSLSNLKSLSFNSKNYVNMKEIATFGHEILVSLLSTDDMKNRIQPLLKYDEKINDLLIMGDETRIKQILLNFVSNSVKFTKTGSITISSSILNNSDFVELSVIDTGIGISNANQEKLFQEFFMIEHSDESINNSLGSGLGLSICKNLANCMGMEISCSSTYLIGSKFAIKIPYTRNRNKNLSFNFIPNTVKSLNDQRRSSSIDMSLNHKKSIEKINNISCRENKQISTKSFEFINNEKQNTFKMTNNDKSSLKDVFYHTNEIELDYKNNDNKSFEIIDNLNEDKENLYENNIHNFIKIENDNEKSVKNINNSNNKILDYDDIETNRKDFDISRKYDIDEVFYKTGKIILIDDSKLINHSVERLVNSILKEINIEYNVICGYDGIDLLHLVKEDQVKGNLIKCIITDENMDYLNGSQAIKIIRELEVKGAIKPLTIFTSTCHEDKVIIQSIIESGSNLLLPKPLCKADLIEAFKNFNIV